jgi:hypothetical protein
MLRIYYYCFSHNRPTGGQKHTYRHVDILSSAGYAAAVVHDKEDFRLSWFENRTPVVDYAQFRESFDEANDFLVLPEDLCDRVGFFPGTRKIIFNKNVFYGFGCFGSKSVAEYAYTRSDVKAAFVVSEHNFRHLRYAFPSLHIELVHPEVDSQKFRMVPLSEKRRQIVIVVKGTSFPDHSICVYHILRARGMSGLNAAMLFDWVFLDGRFSEVQAAQIFRESVAVVFISGSEGLGRVPLEAMSAGCIVVGVRCGPLRETLLAENVGNYAELTEVAEQLEYIMSMFIRGPEELEDLVSRQMRIVERYAPDAQRDSVLRAWGRILGDFH